MKNRLNKYDYLDLYTDEVLECLGYCDEKCTFMLAKCMSMDVHLEDFCNNINVELVIKNNRLYDIQVLTQNNKDNLVKKIYISDCKHLEKILEDTIVLIQTVTQLLPFSRHYDPFYDIKKFLPGHEFLILAHDKDNIFYLENPSDINYKRYEAYKNNKEIGVVQKKEIYPVLERYMECYVANKNENTGITIEQLLCLLKDIVNDFYLTVGPTINQTTNYYGLSAVARLKQIIQEGTINLYDTVQIRPHLNYYKLLSWVFDVIIARRRLLFISIQQVLFSEYKKHKHYDMIQASLIECTKLWKTLKYMLTYNYVKNNNMFDNRYLKLFEKIIEEEKSLINTIENFLMDIDCI